MITLSVLLVQSIVAVNVFKCIESWKRDLEAWSDHWRASMNHDRGGGYNKAFWWRFYEIYAEFWPWISAFSPKSLFCCRIMLDHAILFCYHTNLGVCENFAQRQALTWIMNMLNSGGFWISLIGYDIVELLCMSRPASWCKIPMIIRINCLLKGGFCSI